MPPIGTLRVDLVADSAKFEAGVKAAEVSIGKFAGKAAISVGKLGVSIVSSLTKATKMLTSLPVLLAGAGAAIGTASFVRGLDNAAESVDTLGKASKRLGTTVEDLSVLRFAAGEAGIEFDELAKLSSKALKSVADLVAKGAKTLQLGRVTVQLTEANGQVRSLSKLLPDIARGLESVRNQGDQLRLAEDIFGRGGGDQFITLLKDGGTFIKNLGEQTARAHRLGVVFTDDQVEKLTAYRDAVGRVQQAWFGVKVAIATEVAPVVTDFLNATAERIAGLPSLVRGAIEVLRDVGSDDTFTRRQARETLAEFRDASFGVLKTGAIELGKLAGITIANTAIAAFQAAGPALGDTFRDIAAIVLNELPGIDITRSEGGKLSKLRSDLAGLLQEVTELQHEAERLRSIVDDPSIRAEDTVREVGMLASIQARIDKIRESSKVTDLRNQIKLQEAVVVRQAEERSKALADAVTNLFNVPAAAADAASLKITAAIARFDEAAASLKSFAEPAVFGPPSTPGGGSAGGSPVQFFQMLEASIRSVADTARSSVGGITEFYAAIGRGIRAERTKQQLEEIEELDRKVQGLRLRFYPDERLREDLENLKAALNAGRITYAEYDELAKKLQDELDHVGEKAESLAERMKKAVTGFSDDAARSFADLVVDGKASFEDLAKSWIKTLLEIAAKKLVFDRVFDAIGTGLFGSTPTKSAHGNVFSGGRVVPFASGGVVGSPTTFPMAGGGVGLMGEAGPEGILPLTRVGGDLGVRASGAVTVNVIDQRRGGASPEVSERQGLDGQRVIEVLIRDKVQGMLSDGTLDRQFGANYGLRRRGTGR